ncbi:MAG TPA: hypothetical protein PL112_21260 [Candidatus Obscuribacter sp.]|nr:hypothetical protein [Candidatus Obscuribacter sp.]
MRDAIHRFKHQSIDIWVLDKQFHNCFLLTRGNTIKLLNRSAPPASSCGSLAIVSSDILQSLFTRAACCTRPENLQAPLRYTKKGGKHTPHYKPDEQCTEVSSHFRLDDEKRDHVSNKEEEKKAAAQQLGINKKIKRRTV